MNYLAHLYLSGEDKLLRIGNFIADSVRGKDFSAYPDRVADGIILHRHIDTYTDSHPIVTKSKDVIREQHGHWSSVVIDMFYDHFLASNWDSFHEIPLKAYAADFYKDLLEHHDILPLKVQKFLPIMIEHDWLNAYATVSGMSEILNQMYRRTRYRSTLNIAHHDLNVHYDVLEKHFFTYMEELEEYVFSLTKKPPSLGGVF